MSLQYRTSFGLWVPGGPVARTELTSVRAT